MISNWRGVFAAPNVKDEDLKKLVALVTKMAALPQWQEQLATRGWSDQFLAGDDFGAYLARDIETTRAVLVDLGLA